MPVEIAYLPLQTNGVPRKRVYLWLEGDDSPIEEFLATLAKSRPHDAARLLKLFTVMAENGQIRNPEQFKDVQGHKPLYEFKAHGPRVYCLLHGERVVLLEGDIKTSDKSRSRNKQSINRAERRAKLYLEAAERGAIITR